MNEVLEKYYSGILQQIRGEVDFINSLFSHQGLKGEGNESILRELLLKFIPSRYGVSSGIIVDRNGNSSRQCDIIIYDKHRYPSLLSMSHVHIFPVDIVYAAIEIKTTLNAGSAVESLENIRSVRELEVLARSWMTLEITDVLKENPARNVPALAANENKPSPPVGIVFAYSSNVVNFESFKNWFLPKDQNASGFPTLVCCLDQGIIKFLDVSPKIESIPESYTFPVTKNGEPIVLDAKTGECSYEGRIYPVKSVRNKYLLIDQSKILLLFLTLLSDILVAKKINPSIKFAETYLSYLVPLAMQV